MAVSVSAISKLAVMLNLFKKATVLDLLVLSIVTLFKATLEPTTPDTVDSPSNIKSPTPAALLLIPLVALKLTPFSTLRILLLIWI